MHAHSMFHGTQAENLASTLFQKNNKQIFRNIFNRLLSTISV